MGWQGGVNVTRETGSSAGLTISGSNCPGYSKNTSQPGRERSNKTMNSGLAGEKRRTIITIRKTTMTTTTTMVKVGGVDRIVQKRNVEDYTLYATHRTGYEIFFSMSNVTTHPL